MVWRSHWLAAALIGATLASCNPGKLPQRPQTKPTGNFRTQTLLLPGDSTPSKVTYEIRSGRAIFDGDIILGKVDGEGRLVREAGNGEVRPQAIAANGDGPYWPGGVVPYEIGSSVSAAGVKNVKDAVDHWNNNTSLQIVPRDPSVHKSYVKFVRGDDDGACYSAIGRQGGEQLIELTSSGDCPWGAIVHEIGHAVGLYHEQSREDRDRYITIHWDNVDNGNWWNPFDNRNPQFNKRAINAADSGPYDYDSIMHYGCKAFSKNGKPTISLKNPPADVGCEGENKRVTVGRLDGLSQGDIEAVDAFYSFEPNREGSRSMRCVGNSVCLTGDVNNDGLDDLISFVRKGTPYKPSVPFGQPPLPEVPDAEEGDVYVSLANGTGFEPRRKWHDSFCLGAEKCAVADMTGDGRADIVAFAHEAKTGAFAGDVYVARSDGSRFEAGQKWADKLCATATEVCRLGYVNDDDKADAIVFHNGAYGGSGQVWVALSTGSGFGGGRMWESAFCIHDTEVCEVGDFNNDELTDIVAFHNGAYGGSSAVFVALSDGTSSFTGDKLWHKEFCKEGQLCRIGNVDGKLGDDLLAFDPTVYRALANPPSTAIELLPDAGDVFVALSKGLTFGRGLLRHSHFCYWERACLTGKFNNDDKDDLVWITGMSNPLEHYIPKFGTAVIASSKVR